MEEVLQTHLIKQVLKQTLNTLMFKTQKLLQTLSKILRL